MLFAWWVGVYHRCEVGLLAGNVAYEPAPPLDPPSPGRVLLCREIQSLCHLQYVLMQTDGLIGYELAYCGIESFRRLVLLLKKLLGVGIERLGVDPLVVPRQSVGPIEETFCGLRWY